MKQRRACRHMGVSRGTVRHKRRPEDLLSWVNGRGKVRRGVGRRDQDSDVEWDKSTRTTGLFRCLFLPLESWNECADEKDGSSGITQLQEYSTDIQPL